MCRTVYHKQDEMFDVKCDHRRAVTPEDLCVRFAYVQMGCPAGNLQEGRAVFKEAGAYPEILCRVCGLGDLPEDGDDRYGFWSGMVTWGPNQFGSQLSESEIKAYRLYFVDSQLQKLGDPLHEQEVRLWDTLEMTCCDPTFYKFNIDAYELPQNTSYFMVVPVTTGGLELNVGPHSERIRDHGYTVTATAFARRCAELSSLGLLVFLSFWSSL